jgi:hypothetical protein
MNKIGKQIIYKANPNAMPQSGIITDVSNNGDLCISGVWYSQSNIIILEIKDNNINESQTLILG